MPEARPTPRTAAAGDDSAAAVLRLLGRRAHQLRATTRAAEHFSAQSSEADRNTGSWLMSCALTMSEELAAEVDALARQLKEQPGDVMFKQTV